LKSLLLTVVFLLGLILILFKPVNFVNANRSSATARRDGIGRYWWCHGSGPIGHRDFDDLKILFNEPKSGQNRRTGRNRRKRPVGGEYHNFRLIIFVPHRVSRNAG
jgi:hypothetical protein